MVTSAHLRLIRARKCARPCEDDLSFVPTALSPHVVSLVNHRFRIELDCGDGFVLPGTGKANVTLNRVTVPHVQELPMGLLPACKAVFAIATRNVGDLHLRFSRATCPAVHYALRAFLAPRGPSTSAKKCSPLHFFTPVPTFLLCWRLVPRPQTLHSENLTQDRRVFRLTVANQSPHHALDWVWRRSQL